MNRRLSQRVSAFLVATIALAAVSLVDMEEARACDWGHASIAWTVPADGAEVPPDFQFAFFTSGGFDPEYEAELVDEDGDEIALDVAIHPWAKNLLVETTLYVVSPGELLEYGKYSLTLRNTASYAIDETIEFEFTVTEMTVDPPEAPTAIHWKQYEYEPDDCHSYHTVRNTIELEVETSRDDLWYEITYSNIDELVVGQVDGKPIAQYTEDPPDCVIVEAVALDGTRSEPIEQCVPDECFETTGRWGEFEVYQCDGAATDEDIPIGGCSAASGSLPGPAGLVLVLMMIGAALKRG
jgi:hypothetical protein